VQWIGVNKNANSQIILIFVGAFHPMANVYPGHEAKPRLLIMIT